MKNMKKYITMNPYLVRNLSELGFKKKNKHVFLKKHNDAIISLIFTHSSHFERYAKYYTITINISYIEIEKIKEISQYYNTGFGTNITYTILSKSYDTIAANRIFLEWRIADDDTEKKTNIVINDMCRLLREESIPIIEKYTKIKDVLFAYENNTLPSAFFIDSITYPVLLYLSGDKQKAKTFIKDVFIFWNEQIKAGLVTKDAVTGFIHKDILTKYSGGRFIAPFRLEIYEEFAEKFREYIESKEKIQ